MIPENLPNDAVKHRMTRMFYYMIGLLVFGILKYSVSPASGPMDVVLALIVFCAINTQSYVLLVIFAMFVLLGLVDGVSYVLTFIQNGQPFFDPARQDNMFKLMLIVTMFVRLIGGLFAFELYKELKAAKYGYSSNSGTSNLTPLSPSGIDTSSYADNEAPEGQAKFNAFSGKGVTIG